MDRKRKANGEAVLRDHAEGSSVLFGQRGMNTTSEPLRNFN
jgi:hypothetical protein